MIQPQRILVTGGAGFIGSQIVDGLLRKGHTVAVLDNLSRGRRSHVDAAATFYEVDITDAVGVMAVFQDFRPQVVDHHAAQSSVSRSMREPDVDVTVNVGGSIKVLEASRQIGVERFIFASTGGALYGEPKSLPCGEGHSVCPLSIYGASKYAFEVYLHIYHQTYGLPVTILRYANVYGPRQDPYGEAGVIAIFAQQMMEGRTPTIFGSGEQERDFVYVDDVVKANLLALSAPAWGVYNIGTGVGISVNRIARVLSEILQYGGRIEYTDARPGDVFRIYLDSSLVSKEFGWIPEMVLDDGLALTVKSLQESS
jgi:UDP-glucose 4-epimerase